MEQWQNEFPLVLTRVAGRPEMYIHGCKWKWKQPKRGFPQCRGQLLMCSGGKRVTFNSVGMSGPSDRLEHSAAAARARAPAADGSACLSGGTDGGRGERNGSQSRGSHFS